MMPDPHDLHRFVAAQDRVMAAVRAELAAGRKQSHWMWFVFPQIAGLGHSPTARHYALASRAEAVAFLAHPVLGPRLVECSGLVNAASRPDAHAIFGSPDDMKFHSCMTLFDLVAPAGEGVFRQALDRFFGGRLDAMTPRLLDQAG